MISIFKSAALILLPGIILLNKNEILVQMHGLELAP